MKHKVKQILCFLLAFCVISSFLPAGLVGAVFAEEASVLETAQETEAAQETEVAADETNIPAEETPEIGEEEVTDAQAPADITEYNKQIEQMKEEPTAYET